MSNTTLCYHMEVRHMLLYLEQAKKHRWAIKAKSMKTVFMSGYTFNTLKHVLTQPGVKLDNLPPPPPPDPSNCLPMGVVPSQKQGLGTNLPQFSANGLKDYIICYFVSNDLAINKIEHPDFHQLILYCCPWNITDSEIPHHTKAHELILNNFGTMFAALQAELSH
ncbi:hypothetical protein BS17DRAFT_763620 [Gyrodon lividus]|nr:hypothetical protein BS17DRAFT_763620 [Gyrodon lividus]